MRNLGSDVPAAAPADEAESHYPRGWRVAGCRQGLCRRLGSRRQKGAACGHLREHRDDQETDRGGVWVPRRLREHPHLELRHRRDPQGLPGPVGVGTIYQQVRSVPSRSEERFEVTPTTRPAAWRYEANSGRSPPASPMPWTPSQREPASPTRSSSSSAALAAYLGESPCHVSGTPSPPTSGSSRNCWSNRAMPGRGSDLQPGLGCDRREGVVDRAPTGAAAVGG
jgi:hypothetical protein